MARSKRQPELGVGDGRGFPWACSDLSGGGRGAVELWNAMRGPWEDQGLHIAVERIEDLGDTVLALETMRASGGSSGVPVAIKWAHVITFSNGDQHIRSYATWDEALKAVGLEE